MMRNYQNGTHRDRYCPVYGHEIDAELCYESALCLAGLFTISSVKELHRIYDINEARTKCDACEYSNLK